jgi:DNA polymerase III epsilon subunit-like protein
MYKIIVLDTETTGGTHNDQVIELAYVPVTDSLLTIKRDTEVTNRELIDSLRFDMISERYNPSVPIHPEAFKVHGIAKKDLLGKRPAKDVALPKETILTICHNSPFDMRMLQRKDIPSICTLSLCRALSKKFKLDWPAKLDHLYVELYGEQARDEIKSKHDAATDVIKTVMVLLKMMEKLPGITTFQDLYQFQEALKAGKK